MFNCSLSWSSYFFLFPLCHCWSCLSLVTSSLVRQCAFSGQLLLVSFFLHSDCELCRQSQGVGWLIISLSLSPRGLFLCESQSTVFDLFDTGGVSESSAISVTRTSGFLLLMDLLSLLSLPSTTPSAYANPWVISSFPCNQLCTLPGFLRQELSVSVTLKFGLTSSTSDSEAPVPSGARAGYGEAAPRTIPLELLMYARQKHLQSIQSPVSTRGKTHRCSTTRTQAYGRIYTFCFKPKI